jgi:hypothetical protein
MIAPVRGQPAVHYDMSSSCFKSAAHVHINSGQKTPDLGTIGKNVAFCSKSRPVRTLTRKRIGMAEDSNFSHNEEVELEDNF